MLARSAYQSSVHFKNSSENLYREGFQALIQWILLLYYASVYFLLEGRQKLTGALFRDGSNSFFSELAGILSLEGEGALPFLSAVSTFSAED